MTVCEYLVYLSRSLWMVKYLMVSLGRVLLRQFCCSSLVIVAVLWKINYGRFTCMGRGWCVLFVEGAIL